jgi:hypothetical protein
VPEFDAPTMPAGIREWVPHESPTDAPERVSAPGGLGVEGEAGHIGHEQRHVSSIAPRARLMYRLMETFS